MVMGMGRVAMVVSRPRDGSRSTRLAARLGTTVTIAVILALSVPTARATESPSPVKALTVEPFARGLSSPVFVTGDGTGGGLLYAVERPGTIQVISPDGKVGDTPFLDIHERVLSGDERGLLGLAFHPRFAANGRLFVDYTRTPDGATVISEFHAVDGAADLASERVLLTIPQPFENHNGGMVAFDATGALLIGMGDGGNAGDPMGNGQDRQALLGKMLRLDVDGTEPYAIPADNPFAADTATRPEVWTLGMRNPWRFSLDRATGDVFIGDVGQESFEEVDVVPAGTGGQDFGWNITEGKACYLRTPCDRTGLTDPVAVLPHSTGDCAIIGGYVYRGVRWPALQGQYVFGDLCSGAIRVLDAAQAVATGSAQPRDVGSVGGALSSFGQDDEGELYVVDLTGSVGRLVPAEPPAG
jgi:glucose/arabinose dehydrogenase